MTISYGVRARQLLDKWRLTGLLPSFTHKVRQEINELRYTAALFVWQPATPSKQPPRTITASSDWTHTTALQASTVVSHWLIRENNQWARRLSTNPFKVGFHNTLIPKRKTQMRIIFHKLFLIWSVFHHSITADLDSWKRSVCKKWKWPWLNKPGSHRDLTWGQDPVTDSLNLPGLPASCLQDNGRTERPTLLLKWNIFTLPSSHPHQVRASIFLSSLSNLVSDMFHGASKMAVEAAGRSRSRRGRQVILGPGLMFEVIFYEILPAAVVSHHRNNSVKSSQNQLFTHFKKNSQRLFLK